MEIIARGGGVRWQLYNTRQSAVFNYHRLIPLLMLAIFHACIMHVYMNSALIDLLLLAAIVLYQKNHRHMLSGLIYKLVLNTIQDALANFAL